jgi:hypothetical protein
MSKLMKESQKYDKHIVLILTSIFHIKDKLSQQMKEEEKRKEDKTNVVEKEGE